MAKGTIGTGSDSSNNIRSHYVCERCGTVHNQMTEPEKCTKCGTLYFAWFQNKKDVEEYAERFKGC